MSGCWWRGGVVGPSVADPVALGEHAAQQDEVRVGLAQDLQQTRRTFGEQVMTALV